MTVVVPHLFLPNPSQSGQRHPGRRPRTFLLQLVKDAPMLHKVCIAGKGIDDDGGGGGSIGSACRLVINIIIHRLMTPLLTYGRVEMIDDVPRILANLQSTISCAGECGRHTWMRHPESSHCDARCIISNPGGGARQQDASRSG